MLRSTKHPFVGKHTPTSLPLMTQSPFSQLDSFRRLSMILNFAKQMSPNPSSSKVVPVTRADTKVATTVPDDKPVRILPHRKPSRLCRVLKRLCCFRARRSYCSAPQAPVDHKFTLLPPAATPERKTLVLDLDETIVFADLNVQSTSKFTLPAVFQGTKVKVFVSVRPGWPQFLKKSSKCFDLVFFTAAERCYADAILDHIDPKRVAHRLYRSHCGYHMGTRVKDLSLLGRDLRSVIIIDVRRM